MIKHLLLIGLLFGFIGDHHGDRLARVTLTWDLNPPAENVAFYTLSYYEASTPTVIKSVQSTTPPVTIGLPQTGYWHVYVTANNGQESPQSSELVWHNGGWLTIFQIQGAGKVGQS